MPKTRLLMLSALSLIGLATLVGCNSTQPTVTSESPALSTPMASSPTGPASTTASTGAQGETAGLKNVVSKTQAAVETGDFAKAQSEFEEFEDSWKPIEDGIKEKSPTGYDTIESSMDEVSSALKDSDKTKATAALKSLDQAIAAIPQ